MAKLFKPSVPGQTASQKAEQTESQKVQRRQAERADKQVAQEAQEAGARRRILNSQRRGGSLFAQTGARGVARGTLG